MSSEIGSDPLVPDGTGFGTLKIATNGGYRLSGKMGDGTAFVCSSFMGAMGQVGAFTTLYGGSLRGSVLGTMNVDLGIAPEDPAGHRLSGTWTWSRPDRTPKGGALYPAGFGPLEGIVRGGRLRPSDFILEGVPPVEESDLQLSGGGIHLAERDPSQRVNLMAGNRLLLPESQIGDRLTFTPKTGRIQGTAALSDPHWEKPAPARWKRTLRFEGIVIPVDGGGREGVGFYLLPQIPEPGLNNGPPAILSGRLLWKAR
jgi:hypothetical protein